MENSYASLSLCSEMGLSGATPNDFTFSLNLKACGLLNSLDIGRQTHDIRVRTGFDMEESLVGNSTCSQTMEESLKPPVCLHCLKEGNQTHAFSIASGLLYSVNTAIAGADISENFGSVE
ncbi:hypothetical protein DKX38_027884 [Salix brachista]|uniref:Uncharacterized protein n=1 Tax=Salix brachista TaxID=2182728 RepID=A0A5N5J459_9ROSI|nr:hypothetical protein DKX38_027884 [Salix brachista]